MRIFGRTATVFVIGLALGAFQKGKTGVTCSDYEPWHYRWVGRDLAQRLTTAGTVLREYQAGLR